MGNGAMMTENAPVAIVFMAVNSTMVFVWLARAQQTIIVPEAPSVEQPGFVRLPRVMVVWADAARMMAIVKPVSIASVPLVPNSAGASVIQPLLSRHQK